MNIYERKYCLIAYIIFIIGVVFSVINGKLVYANETTSDAIDEFESNTFSAYAQISIDAMFVFAEEFHVYEYAIFLSEDKIGILRISKNHPDYEALIDGSEEGIIVKGRSRIFDDEIIDIIIDGLDEIDSKDQFESYFGKYYLDTTYKPGWFSQATGGISSFEFNSILYLIFLIGGIVAVFLIIRKNKNAASKKNYQYQDSNTYHGYNPNYQTHTGPNAIQLTVNEKRYIDEKIKYLYQELKIPPFEDCLISEAIIERLSQYVKESGKDDAVIKELVGEILSYTGMIKQWVDVEVVYNHDTDRTVENVKTAGAYSETGFLYGKIRILVEPRYSTSTIIAICCHECAHHFLYKRRVIIDDALENEKLTDLATVYMGFGLYVKEAYAEKLIDSNTISKLGYLSAAEIRYAFFEMVKMQVGVEVKNELINGLVNDIKSRIIELRSDVLKNIEAMRAIDNYDIAYNTEGSLKLMFENYNIILTGEMNEWERLFFQKLEKTQADLNGLMLLQNEIEDYRTRIFEYNKAVAKFSQLSQYQLNLSTEAIVSLKKIHSDASRYDADSVMTLIKYYLSLPGFADDAVWYFEKLAECKDGEGYCCLGDCYSMGIVADKDLEIAKYYYNNAVQMGSSSAKERIEDLANGTIRSTVLRLPGRLGPFR